MIKEELKLLELSVSGDKKAFEELVKPYLKQIYNISYRILNNVEDAKDASQEVLIKVYNNLAMFNAQSKLSTWIYRISVNVANDIIRKEIKNKKISLDQKLEEFGDAILYDKNLEENNPEKILEQRELQREILDSISNLDEKYRELIILRDLQGCSYSEIAEILEKNIGSVKSGINRARQKLASDLIDKGIRPSNYERRG